MSQTQTQTCLCIGDLFHIFHWNEERFPLVVILMINYGGGAFMRENILSLSLSFLSLTEQVACLILS